jgi:hypothetical protein
MVIHPIAGNTQPLRLAAGMTENFRQPVPKHYKFFFSHFSQVFTNLVNVKRKIQNEDKSTLLAALSILHFPFSS